MATVKLTDEQRASKLLVGKLARVHGALREHVMPRGAASDLFAAFSEIDSILRDFRSGALAVTRVANTKRDMGVD